MSGSALWLEAWNYWERCHSFSWFSLVFFFFSESNSFAFCNTQWPSHTFSRRLSHQSFGLDDTPKVLHQVWPIWTCRHPWFSTMNMSTWISFSYNHYMSFTPYSTNSCRLAVLASVSMNAIMPEHSIYYWLQCEHGELIVVIFLIIFYCVVHCRL